MSTEPSACSEKSRVSRVGRRSADIRPSLRVMYRPSPVLTHFRFFCSGCRRSTWPASVSTSLPSMRICTRLIAGRFIVSALTIA